MNLAGREREKRSSSCHCQLKALGMSLYIVHWRDAPVTSLVTAIMVIIVRNFIGHIVHWTALYRLHITPLRGFTSGPSHDAVGPARSRAAHGSLSSSIHNQDRVSPRFRGKPGSLLLDMRGPGTHTSFFNLGKEKSQMLPVAYNCWEPPPPPSVVQNHMFQGPGAVPVRYPTQEARQLSHIPFGTLQGTLGANRGSLRSSKRPCMCSWALPILSTTLHSTLQ